MLAPCSLPPARALAARLPHPVSAAARLSGDPAKPFPMGQATTHDRRRRDPDCSQRVGSLHPTGYPLYVVSGNVLTALMRVLGISPIVAPALVSLLWGMLALLLLYVFGMHLGASPWLAAGVALLFGPHATVWIHNVIAEIYSFKPAAPVDPPESPVWRGLRRSHITWLAVMGGIALAHHRAFITLIPALLYAIWQRCAPAAESCRGCDY